MRLSSSPFVFFAMIASCFLFGCHEEPAAENVSEPAAALPPGVRTLVLIGNDRGMIRPCGCAKPKLGGIDRRLAWLASRSPEKKSKSAVLAFGNQVLSGRRQQEMKMEIFLQAFSEVPVKGYLAGDMDLLLGASFWRDSAPQLATMPVVAANVTVGDDRPFRRFIRFDVDGGPIVVTGIVPGSSAREIDPDIRIEESPSPVEIKEALEAAGKGVVLVIYTSGTEAEALALSNAVAAKDLVRRTLVVRTGFSDMPQMTPRPYGSLVDLGTKGRWLAEVAIDGPGIEITTLDEKVGSDALGLELLDFYRKLVANERLLELDTKSSTVSADGYIGSEACAKCHEAAAKAWNESKHSRAWATLEASGDVADPECVRCHVTGYHDDGGFTALRGKPTNVQCEACHGPSRAHTETLAPTPKGKLDARSCVSCHDPENSPTFDFKTYWPKIEHR